MSELRRVTVPLADRSYDVLVGHGAATYLGSVIPDSARRAAIVTQSDLPFEIEANIWHECFRIGRGEQHKTLETIGELCRGFARMGLTRNDVVIGVGGGIVTDVAGFAAASYHRGVPVVHVATTLLGMVDAAIGGKTGVNLPEGKNLVGAFWQPSAVLCDTDMLKTLPIREFQSGMGEVAKYHFLGGGRLDELEIDDRVAACVRIKADVVSGDEREGGRRAVLNYGHTLAHAIETAGGYSLRHGEAVAVGIAYAAEVALRLGRIDEARVDEHRRVLSAYDLPHSLPPGLDPAELLDLFSRDKKAIDGVTFVLDGDNGVETVVDVDRTVLADAMEAIR